MFLWRDLRRLAAHAAQEADAAAYSHEIIPAGLLKEERKVRKTTSKVMRKTSPQSARRRIGRSKQILSKVKRRVAR